MGNTDPARPSLFKKFGKNTPVAHPDEPVTTSPVVPDLAAPVNHEPQFREPSEDATRYRILMEQSRDGIVVFDQDGAVIESNQRFADMLGYTIEEMRRLHVWDWDAAKSREEILAMIRDVDEKGIHFETKHQRKDGSVYDAEISSNGAMFGGRKLVFSVNRDITERKQAEEALRRSEARYRSVVELAQDGICILQEGVIKYCNPSLARIWGGTAKEVEGTPFTNYVHPASLPLVTERYRRRIAGEPVPSSYEISLINREGSRFYVELNVGILEFAGQEAELVVVHDITERKGAEKDLKASEERWQFALEGAGDGVWDWNVQTNEVFFSRRWKAMLGFEEDEIGHTLDEWERRVHPDDKERVNAEIEEYLSGRTPTYSSEHRVVCKDGSYKWVLDRGQIVSHDKNGMPSRFIGTHTDITGFKQAQDSLTRSNRALKVISACNDTLVRATEEGTLLKDICRVIVNLGGYRLAWVGFARDDAKKTVLPVAQAGYDAGFLQSVKITWGEDESGTGPTGTAIRTGQPDVLREISTDPRYALWRVDAMERGYASLLSLPLAAGDKVFGALGIYAAEADAFNPEEIDLLTELSKDLAYGVTALRLRAEHRGTVANLAASEEKYRTLFETAAEGIIIINARTKKIRYANPAIGRMLGYSTEQLAHMGMADIHPADSLAMVVPEFEAQARGEKNLSMNIPCLRKDATVLYVDVTSAKASIDGSEQIVSFFTDVTQRRLVEEERKRAEERLLRAMIKTIELMSRTMEMKDPYTAGHQERVTIIAIAIAKEMGLKDTEVQGLRLAAIVHDIGKIQVPAEILSKPGRLSDLEYSLIKVHAQAGYDIIKDVEFPWPIADMLLQHHERWDGTGYPQGLKGKDILPGARILAVADVVEAMGSHRPYRPSLGLDKAIGEITANRGVLYDAAVVDACLKLFKKGFEFEKKPPV
jgi:PAS domain S-box-containing protein